MAKTALIVVDMLNPYEHEDADKLTESVERVVPAISELRDRATGEGIPTIYVNDNHGDWESSRLAHIFGDLADASLHMMERNMHAQVCEAEECRLGERH